jgi:hypothetical protein
VKRRTRKKRVDQQQVQSTLFLSRVREVQERYAHAHEAMKNWAAWSGQGLGKLVPHLDPPPQGKLYSPADYEDEDTPLGTNPVEVDPLTPQPDERAAERVDVAISGPDVPHAWRALARALYIEPQEWRDLRRRLGLMRDEMVFLNLESLLRHVTWRIGPCPSDRNARVHTRAAQPSSPKVDALNTAP